MNNQKQESQISKVDPLNISFSNEKDFLNSTPSQMSPQSPQSHKKSCSIIIKNPHQLFSEEKILMTCINCVKFKRYEYLQETRYVSAKKVINVYEEYMCKQISLLKIPIKQRHFINKSVRNDCSVRMGLGIVTSHLKDIQRIQSLISKVNSRIYTHKRLRG